MTCPIVKKCWSTCQSEACAAGAACSKAPKAAAAPHQHPDLPIDIVPTWDQWLEDVATSLRYLVFVSAGFLLLFAIGFVTVTWLIK